MGDGDVVFQLDDGIGSEEIFSYWKGWRIHWIYLLQRLYHVESSVGLLYSSMEPIDAGDAVYRCRC